VPLSSSRMSARLSALSGPTTLCHDILKKLEVLGAHIARSGPPNAYSKSRNRGPAYQIPYLQAGPRDIQGIGDLRLLILAALHAKPPMRTGQVHTNRFPDVPALK